MDLSSILSFFSALCCTGGLIYLVVEKLFSRKHDEADTKAQVISNSNEIAELYSKIDEIVTSKTAPILEELDGIKAHWCCYREECEMRILSPYQTTTKKDEDIR